MCRAAMDTLGSNVDAVLMRVQGFEASATRTVSIDFNAREEMPPPLAQ